MNAPQEAFVRREATQREIPKDYRERAQWFAREFGESLSAHLANLCRFFPSVPKGKAVSYVAVEDGYVHAQYGPYHFHFPEETGLGRLSAIDWMERYSVEIDGREIPLDTGIQEIRDEIESRVDSALDTRKERLLAKLLPPKVEAKTNSRNVMVKKSVRIRKI